MNKLIFLLCVAAFVSCNKVERCYQCTFTTYQKPPYANNVQGGEICGKNKKDVRAKIEKYNSPDRIKFGNVKCNID